MKSTNVTQIVVLGVFIFFLIVGILVFAVFGSSNSGTTITDATVSVWGVLPEDLFNNLQSQLADTSNKLNISYHYIPKDAFNQTLVESIANGEGPDAILIPSDLLVKNQKRALVIGFNTLSSQTFKDTFIQGAESLLVNNGTLGLPFLVDPYVMYWNRDILTSKGVTTPPDTWEKVLSLSAKLTQRKDDKTILKSTVAFGDYQNIDHAKQIILTLMMQAGSPLIVREVDNTLSNYIGDLGGYEAPPSASALSFFAGFADPLKPTYSWNRSLPQASQAFINGDLAFYFGPASEARKLRARNPNLNFGVAQVPEPQGADVKKVYGDLYSFLILQTSKNQADAYTVISSLTSADTNNRASLLTGLPSARRDLLADIPKSSEAEVFWKSALWAIPWFDPDPSLTDKAFGGAVDNITAGAQKPEEAIKVITSQINELLNK